MSARRCATHHHACDCREERFLEIEAERDALCGCDDPLPDARDTFVRLWDSLNAKRGYGWGSNPWVFVYSFECCEP